MSEEYTEGRRHELYTAAAQSWGPRPAETLMAGLSPVRWHTFATKDDLHAVEASIRKDIQVLQESTAKDFQLVRAELSTAVAELREFVRQQSNKLVWGVAVMVVTAVVSQPIVAHFFPPPAPHPPPNPPPPRSRVLPPDSPVDERRRVS